MAADNQNTATSATPSFQVRVNGKAIPAEYNLVSAAIYNEVNRLATARLIFLDGDPALNDFPLSNKPDFLPGAAIIVEAGYQGNNTIVYKGIVIKHSIKLNHNKSTFLTVDCKHGAVKMTKTRKSKIFTDQTDSDIFSSLIRPYGVTLDADDTTISHKQMVQFNCSDWDFIITRAEANGLLAWADADKMVIKKPTLSGEGVMELKFGTNLLEFDAEMDSRYQFETVTATAWDQTEKIPAEAEGSAPSGFQQQGNVSIGDLASATGDSEIRIMHGAYVDDSELRAWASSQQLKYSLSKIRGRAKCQGSDKLKPGVIIKLSGVGDRFNGKAFVSAVRHEMSQGNWLTDVEFGLSPKLFIKQFDVNEWPASGMISAVAGLQVGVVTQLENDPISEYRVLVKIPMADNTSEGIWARQALLDAGNERGSFFRPEVGDEVILGFINDDPRHAVILGMLNSSAIPAVTEASDDNHEKGFVTREKMKLWFNDKKKAIEISTPGGNSVLLDEDQKKIVFKDQNGNEIMMSEDGIVIKSVKDIKLDAASGKISESGMNIESKANASVKITGSSGTEISSTGTTTVKGSIVQIN